ncbi:MAG: hypothetical protein E6Q98_25785 [Rhodospirillaceae bacterium]|nr:MAG: hypothetical protein E6Q98_25785 [Rhodospirillaceae bacterium]
MAKLIWLGEPEGGEDGPRKNTWNGHTFIRGEEVEVTDEHMIAKARKNPFYSVDGEVYVPDGGQPHPNAAGAVVRDKSEYSEYSVGELRQIAAERGIDVEGQKKAEIIETLMNTPA